MCDIHTNEESLCVIVLSYFHLDNRSFKYAAEYIVYFLDQTLYCILSEHSNIR